MSTTTQVQEEKKVLTREEKLDLLLKPVYESVDGDVEQNLGKNYLVKLESRYPATFKITNKEEAHQVATDLVYINKQLKLSEKVLEQVLEDYVFKMNSFKIFISEAKDQVKKMQTGALEEKKKLLTKFNSDWVLAEKARIERERAEALKAAQELLNNTQAAILKNTDLTKAELKNEIDIRMAKVEQNINNTIVLENKFNTDLGSMSNSILLTLDEENIDVLKIAKWILDNPEHKDLLIVNKGYASKNFKPTKTNKVLTVPGLPYKDLVSARTR